MQRSKFSLLDASKLLSRYFDLVQPITVDDLKSAYRAKSKQLHPDLNPNGEAMFKEMQEVYEFLTDFTIIAAICVNKDGTLVGVLKTSGGIPLSELGLGLGNTKNGRDCPSCTRKGYIEHKSLGIERCTHCLFGMTKSHPCRSCKGTGQFKQKRGAVVNCRDCKGMGSYETHYSHLCGWCRGMFYIPTAQEKIIYEICFDCKGIGEIEIHNPVIAKGILAAVTSFMK